MTPNLLGSSGLLLAGVTEEPSSKKQEVQASNTNAIVAANQDPLDDPYKWRIVWKNVIAMTYLHCGFLYGWYLLFTATKLATFTWAIGIGILSAFGVTAGAHRLWCHRSYKATWQLRIILMLLQTIAFQNHVYEWVRDHRVHHKYTDTDADPHNSKRGFFFSHMGWLLVRKHPDVKIKGRNIDMSDLREDPVVMFQKKMYPVLMPIFSFLLPTVVPWYYWSESWWTSWYICAIFRYTLSLHFTWLVNSAAHIYGTRPYDVSISPTENRTVGYLAMGEGWHNYHHSFPWDYKAAELPTYGQNWSLFVINQMAKIGWAYDLKTVSESMVLKRVKRTGDGSHHTYEEQFWGWGDRDMKEEDVKYCEILHRRIETEKVN